MIAALEADPSIAHTTPVIETIALLNIGRNDPNPIQVMGIEPESYHAVTGFYDNLLWDGPDVAEALNRRWQKYGETDGHPDASWWRQRPLNEEARRLSCRVPGMDGQEAEVPAAVAGVITVRPRRPRDKQGKYSADDSWLHNGMPMVPERIGRGEIELLLMKLNDPGSGVFSLQEMDADNVPIRRLPVVNEFQTGFVEADSKRVMVSFDWLQQQLDMHATSQVTLDQSALTLDPETGYFQDPQGRGLVDIHRKRLLDAKSLEDIGPWDGLSAPARKARANRLLIRSADGFTPQDTARAADDILAQLEHEGIIRATGSLYAVPWDQSDMVGGLVDAVRNEKGLMTFLFVVVSLVSLVMVASTFYMIVLEKTREIGTLRAIGASRKSIVGLFLMYGQVVGIVGALAGVGLACFVVWHLNDMQQALAHRLGNLIGMVSLTVLLILAGTILAAWQGRKRTGEGVPAGVSALVLGTIGWTAATFYLFPHINLPLLGVLDGQIAIRLWDPQLYYFESIPSSISSTETFWVAIGAILSSTAGAVIPAFVASTVDPIQSLHHD